MRILVGHVMLSATQAGVRRYTLTIGVCLALVAAPALAQDREDDETRQRTDSGWIPAFSLLTAGNFEGRDGTIESQERGRFRDDSVFALWSLSFSTELSTPAWSDLAGRPRMFVHADVVTLFDPEAPVVNDADPGPLRVLSQLPGGGGLAPLAGVQGRGSSLRAQADTLALSAGAGITFHADLWERSLRIKPSIEWFWQQEQIIATLAEAESEGANPDFCGPCRTLFIRDSRRNNFHSLGPGLELELDAARISDFVLTVFASGRAYHILGDRKVAFESTGTWMVEGSPSEVRPDSTFTSSYKREPWHFQAGIGVRLRWLPE